jgi:hypothetical protein
LASHHDGFLGAGTRIVAIDIDSPGQHAAMVEKLDLPFPYLSDPDRTGAIEPYGLADPLDERNLAIPALVLVDREREEVWRWVARDFADRIPEAEALDQVRSLGLDRVAAAPMENGEPEPGPKAMPVRAMGSYFRGARFASVAFYRRMREIPEAKDAAKAEMTAYVDEMDRYIAAVKDLRERTGQ